MTDRTINKKVSWKKSIRVFQFLLPYKGMFSIGLIILFASSIISMIFPKILGDLIDAAKNTTTKDINRYTFILVGIFLGNAILSFFRVYLFNIVTHKALQSLRNTTYKKLITAPMSFFHSKRVGELSSRITSDIALLEETYTVTTAEFFRQLITIPVGLFFLLYISVKLTFFMLATIPVVVIIALIFGKFIKKLSKKSQQEIADANTIVDETLHGIVNVKAYANEFFESIRYGKKIESATHIAIKRAKWRGIFIATIIFTSGASIIAIIRYGLQLVQADLLSIGDLLSFTIYSAMLGMSFGGLANLFAGIQKAVGATENLMDIIEHPVEIINTEESAATIENGTIEFQDVNFHYPSRKDVPVIQNFSLNIQQGQQIAFVGASGAGKSTIVSLLYRFYDPVSGKILLNGKDTSSYPLSDYRNIFAYVPQEIILFGGTIIENISYGNPNASKEAIISAAHKANAWEFIEQFPEKMDTIVGDRGIQLSGGQKQRIAIARAILKDPAILILDEATSALDSNAEHLVQDALEKLMRNRTSLVIAHRLSTIKKADAIIVMHNGQIKEMGNHDELIVEGNHYHKLVVMQDLAIN